MKYGKRIAALALAALFSLSAAAPVFAAEEAAPYTIEYSKIEQTVLGQNLQVSSNQLCLTGMDDKNELKKKYETLSDRLSGAASGMSAIANDPTLDGSQTSKDLKAAANGTALSLSALTSMLEMQEDVSDDDYKLAELQYDLADNQLVKTAQSLYTTHYELACSLQKLTDSRALLQNAEKAAQAQYDLRRGTALAVSQAKDALNAADDSITDLQNQSKALDSQMNRLLGRSYGDPITFGAMPQPDTAYADKIDLAKDAAAAQEASYAVRIGRQKLAILEDDTREDRDRRSAARNGIDQEVQNAGAALSKQYDAIQKQRTVLAAEQRKLTTAKAGADQAQKKYAAGLISSMQYDQARYEALSQDLSVKTASAELFREIEFYKWIMKGLPDT